MTSVTVAGGSFDAPRRVRRAKNFSLSPRHQSWLRYGVGVSIAGLLSANGFALMSMLGDAARELTGAADRTAATAPAETVSSAVDVPGAGFAAFDVPADLDAHYRAMASLSATAASPTPAAAPAELVATVPAAQPNVATTPAPAQGTTSSNRDNSGTGGNSDTDGPQATDPSVVDQVIATVETVPAVGATVAPVAEAVATEVEETVVDPVVETVTEPAPEPVAEGVSETVGSLL